MRDRIISTTSEWTFELIERYEREIARVAADFRLDTYPNQLEVISSEQMMDAYASVGMPVGYHHWSFGKQFIATEQRYRHGMMGLAYEIVINSNPCIAYLMEENTLPMQALVIAHASFGHNSFFKGNYLFRTWTNADAIIDYLVFARDYIAECERRHGEVEVERVLDSCHALMDYGVDSCKRPAPLTAESERMKQHEREEYMQSRVNELWRTVPGAEREERRHGERVFPEEPQENLLYFIEKNAPFLEPWKREVVRIVRKLAQYFFPQRQTQVMNEVGHVLALHDPEPALRRGSGQRRLHARVPAVAHQRGRAAGLRRPALLGHQPLRPRLRDDARHRAHLPRADCGGPGLVPGPRRQRLDRRARLRDAQLQGRELHRPVRRT